MPERPERGFYTAVLYDAPGGRAAAQYPFDIQALRSLRTLELDAQITFFVGENGSGKSTLLEAIAIAAGFNAEGGTRNIRFSHRPTESELWRSLDLTKGGRDPRTGFFLRAETMFNLFTEVESQGLMEYGWQPMHDKSHGEALLWTVENRFGGQGFFLLDEPESALSPQRQLALLRFMHDLMDAGGQFVVATHSPILLAYPDACIYQFGTGGIQRIAYEDTEHYRVTKMVLDSPDRVFRHLLAD